ncbi:MAG: nucleotidyltransferase domain-containing protein [Bacteroidetes bacterium]|nr:nucleotidyltransferase domain-containing protein [Bacteroidota bacterium]MBU2586461.1 nucleotidyltransferase domain-containing protein [Bacteroidota bacterium]
MISNDDKYRLVELAKKYDVSKLYLFGSNLEPERESKDIDLAVEGIADSLFFKFYSELIFALSKPVDLIDLDKKSLLNTMVKSEGVLIYG